MTIPVYKPKVSRREVLPPSKVPALPTTYGNKHTSLATPGYIWVTNTGTNSVERINTTTLVVDSFPTNGLTPSGLAFDGTHLYITCFGSNSIVKMTTAGVIVSTATAIGFGTHQVIFDGTHLWVTAYWSGVVYKLTTALAIVNSYLLGHYPLNLTFDGSKVWVAGFDFTTYANGSGVVAKFNLDTSLAASYTIGANPYGIAFGGGFIWVAALQGGNIYKVNPTTGAIVATYSTGVTDATVTGFSFVDFAGGILIVTVSKDYSPYNLPGNYNKSHVISISDGSLYQLEPLGIDPRNASVDSFNYVYTAGYGDGSVARYPLLSSTPHPNYLLNFTTLPPVDTATGVGAPIAPAPTIAGTLSLIAGVFANAALAITDVELFIYPNPVSFIEDKDYTIRFHYRSDGRSYSPIISNGSALDTLFIYGTTYQLGFGIGNSVDSGITPATTGFDKVSVERKAGILYLYINGTRVAVNSAPTAARFISAEPIDLTLRLAAVSDFGLFLGTALANGAASYTPETAQFS